MHKDKPKPTSMEIILASLALACQREAIGNTGSGNRTQRPTAKSKQTPETKTSQTTKTKKRKRNRNQRHKERKAARHGTRRRIKQKFPESACQQHFNCWCSAWKDFVVQPSQIAIANTDCSILLTLLLMPCLAEPTNAIHVATMPTGGESQGIVSEP